ncbi:VAN3-binding protein [Trifolium repens]|nr:VAN3-binding protein [Trifolium repens]
MEFLARSWSLSATELSKALHSTNTRGARAIEMQLLCSSDQFYTKGFTAPEDSLSNECCPQILPKESGETKDLFLLHQALSPEFLSNQNLLRNGESCIQSLIRGRTTGRWLKDQKERKKQEIRTHNAQVHAAVSVVGVAAAVAAVAASIVSSEKPDAYQKNPTMASAAIASAAALVASHCIEIAEDMGAEQDQIITAVDSAINAKTNGDIMTLTAGAATALRGAATLKARLQKGGGVLLKRTRKGVLHWKQVSFDVNSNLQVVAKMKSKHIGGTFTKKKKYIVTGVCSDIPAWPGREKEDIGKQRAYFVIGITL